MNVKLITKSAILAALVLLFTLISVPAPITGYMNLGDVFVLLSGCTLPPFFAFAASAVGASLADIFLGFGIYAPATLVIKGFMALVLSLIYKKAKNKTGITVFLSMVLSEVIMVIGYYLYDSFLLGSFVSAAATLLPNTIQGSVGFVCAYLLLRIVPKNKFNL